MIYQFLGKEKSIKNSIINILATEYPLSSKKICNLIKKQGFGVSYHAVYKALQQLFSQGVLNKNGKVYRINGKWIKNSRAFVEKMYSSYNNAMPLDMTFNSLSELNEFILAFLRKNYLKANKEVCVSVWEYFFWPLLFEKHGYSDLKKIANKENIYLICRDSSAISKWCANFYKNLGMNVKIGIKDLRIPDCIIYKGMMIQIFWPKEILELFDNLYSKSKIEDLHLNDFFENVIERKARFDVLCIENNYIAGKIRTQISSKFRM